MNVSQYLSEVTIDSPLPDNPIGSFRNRWRKGFSFSPAMAREITLPASQEARDMMMIENLWKVTGEAFIAKPLIDLTTFGRLRREEPSNTAGWVFLLQRGANGQAKIVLPG